MAVTVARVHLAMAHAALPGLLPTPPRCMPLLPTPPCVVILPSAPPRPSRADAVERWDAHKTKSAGSAAASSSSSSGGGGQRSLDGKSSGSPGRASSCERWDSNKKKSAAMSSSSSCSSRADSVERWDANKKRASPASSSSSSASSSSSRCHGSNKRSNSRAARTSSSAKRWDAHKKKPRTPLAVGLDDGDDGASSTGSNDMDLLPDMPRPKPPQRGLYAGPGFIASPEPSMLPMPSFFMVRVA